MRDLAAGRGRHAGSASQTTVSYPRKARKRPRWSARRSEEYGEKAAAADPKDNGAPDKSVVKQTVGISLPTCPTILRHAAGDTDPGQRSGRRRHDVDANRPQAESGVPPESHR